MHRLYKGRMCSSAWPHQQPNPCRHCWVTAVVFDNQRWSKSPIWLPLILLLNDLGITQDIMGHRCQMGKRSAEMWRGKGVLVLIRLDKSRDTRPGRQQGQRCHHHHFPRHGCRICSTRESSCCHSRIHSHWPRSTLNQWLQRYLQQLESPRALKVKSLQTLECNTNQQT